MNLALRMVCWARGHLYFIKQDFGHRSRRVQCERCEGDWAMGDDTNTFLTWDKDFEELYTALGYKVLK